MVASGRFMYYWGHFFLLLPRCYFLEGLLREVLLYVHNTDMPTLTPYTHFFLTISLLNYVLALWSLTIFMLHF